MMVRRLSVIAIILAAAVLAYGFIDARSYRAGYAAGSVTVSRLVNRACENGFVSDNNLCEAAEVALYPAPPDAVMGLADVRQTLGADQSASVESSTVKPKSKRVRNRKLSKTPVVQSQEGSTLTTDVTSAPVAEQAMLVQPATPPPLSPEEEKAYTLITDARQLSETSCSQYTTDRSACIEKGNFKCGMDTGTCAFKSIITGLRAIPIGQEAQYIPCLTSQIRSMIGVAKLVGNNFCVTIDGSSQMVDRINPSEKRFSNEFARDPKFKEDLAKAGVSASTTAVPVTATAVTPTLPTCPTPTLQNPMPSMPAGGCIAPTMPMMPYGNMPYMPPAGGGYMPPYSSIYKPSTFAQLIDVIMSLFR